MMLSLCLRRIEVGKTRQSFSLGSSVVNADGETLKPMCRDNLNDEFACDPTLEMYFVGAKCVTFGFERSPTQHGALRVAGIRDPRPSSDEGGRHVAGDATHHRKESRRALSPRAVAARWSRGGEQGCTVEDGHRSTLRSHRSCREDSRRASSFTA